MLYGLTKVELTVFTLELDFQKSNSAALASTPHVPCWARVLDWRTQLGLVTTQRYHPFPTTSMHSPSNSAMNSPAAPIWMHTFTQNSNSFIIYLISTTWAVYLFTLLAKGRIGIRGALKILAKPGFESANTFLKVTILLHSHILLNDQQWPNLISLSDEFTTLNKLNWKPFRNVMQCAQKLQIPKPYISWRQANWSKN